MVIKVYKEFYKSIVSYICVLRVDC